MTITSAAGSAGCVCAAGRETSVPGHGPQGCACAGGVSGTQCSGGCQRQGTPRPRFFAGQLLTEDDLEALTAYVAAKSRLHTRYLAGAGVVCGLEVACNPYGGGTIRVQPGYALDCCGRDIVVPCATDLDVNAMVRDLRLSQLGADCGDPCPPPKARTTTTTEEEGEEPAHEPARHYCLYLQYEEQLTDPVAPYVTEEPCGQPACEPTRVYEGYQFLLRCQSHRPSRATIADRLHHCLHHPRASQLAEDLTRYAGPLGEAGDPAEPLPFDNQALDTATRDLATAVEPGSTLTPEQARALAGKVEAVAAELARLQLQDDAGIAQQHAAVIQTARTGLAPAITALADPPKGTWADPLDQQAAQALMTQTQQLAEQTSPLNPTEARMLAQRAPFDRNVWSVIADSATELRDWLLCQLDNDPQLTDGELRAAMARIPIPDTGAEAINRTAATMTSRLAQELTELLRRYERMCVCAAINPPCQSCDDSDVLLACMEVRDCAVVQVCATVRDWVISGPALRYWIPQLGQLQEIIDTYCCGTKADAGGLAAGDVLPGPLSQALGTPDDGAVADQLAGLRAKVDMLARQIAIAHTTASTEKPSIFRLYQARRRGG